MAVKFTPQFTEKDLRNFIAKQVNRVDETVFDLLQQIAEQFVSDARSTNTYTDRTGNLRSSIGYVIIKDGKEVFGNFNGTNDGVASSKKLIRNIKSDYPRGYALIVVAGMNYGIYVEAKGFDVLTGSSLVASGNLEKAFNRLKESLSKI